MLRDATYPVQKFCKTRITPIAMTLTLESYLLQYLHSCDCMRKCHELHYHNALRIK